MTKSFWLISLGLLVVMAASVFLTPLFQLQTTLCQVDVNPCPQELIDYLSQLKQRNLLFISRARLINHLNQLYPHFQNPQVLIHLPHTLRVTLVSRIPVALLATDSSYLIPIDSTGMFLKSPPPPNLPIISLATPSAELIPTALKLLSLLNQAFINPTSVSATESGILDVGLPSGQLARFSRLKDLAAQVNSLQVILHKSTIVPPANVIDVRFDKPVLVN